MIRSTGTEHCFEWRFGFSIAILLASTMVGIVNSTIAEDAFLNSSDTISPARALLLYPHLFDRQEDHSFENIMYHSLRARWGTALEFVDRFPPDRSLPIDDPDGRIECSIRRFKELLSSGEYGLYILATHGSPETILIEPYCRPTPCQETEDISEYYAMLAWYRYVGEDFCDPEVANADYDGDGTPLKGPGNDAKVDTWVKSNGVHARPSDYGLPDPDPDDQGDIFWAVFDANENGVLEPGEDFDHYGDNAPGLRGDPNSGAGDEDEYWTATPSPTPNLTDSPTPTSTPPAQTASPTPHIYRLNELQVGKYHHWTSAWHYYGVDVTSDFITRYGQYSPDALVYVGACSAFGMADAWRNPPMNVANYISHDADIGDLTIRGPTMELFFRAMSFGADQLWNMNVEEAFLYSPHQPANLAIDSASRCESRMVLYEGDFYVVATPRAYPTHGPLGSIANPYVIANYTDASECIQIALQAAALATPTPVPTPAPWETPSAPSEARRVVHVGPGIYEIATPLAVPEGLTLKGSGPHRTTLKAMASAGWILFDYGLGNPLYEVTTIEDFHLLDGWPAIIVSEFASPHDREFKLLIRNNVFTSIYDLATSVEIYEGGSLLDSCYGLEGGAPLIFNNLFSFALEDGSGIITHCNSTEISHNTFVFPGVGADSEGVQAGWSCQAGLYCQASIHDNIFVGNGIYLHGGAHPEMKLNTFWEDGDGHWFDNQSGDPSPDPAWGWEADNDIDSDPLHVPGPMQGYLGAHGVYYLDPTSPAQQSAGDRMTAEGFHRLTTDPDQVVVPVPTVMHLPATRADRGYHHPILCSTLPSATPTWTPTETPTTTPSGWPSSTPTITPTGTPTPTATDTPTIGPTPIIGTYIEDFQSGATGWSWDGLWHHSTADGHEDSASMWYGIEGPDDYDTGAANCDGLVSPPILLDAGSVITLWSKERTEGSETFDSRRVQISTDGGSEWIELVQLLDDHGEWYSVESYDLAGFAGLVARFRFEFDTVDDRFNHWLGWRIDDVFVGVPPTVTPTPTAAPPVPAAGAGGMLLMILLMSTALGAGLGSRKLFGK